MKKRTIGLATLYLGDCFDAAADLTVAADALITDPPYSSGGMMRGDRALTSAQGKYVQSQYRRLQHNADFTGDNRDARSWAFWVSTWMRVYQPLVKSGGRVMCFTDWRQLPSLSDALQAGGFVWRGVIAWDKTGGARAPHVGYFRHQCEYVLWGSNGRLGKAAPGGPFPGVIRESVKQRDKFHMAGKPEIVMAELVRPVPVGGACGRSVYRVGVNWRRRRQK